MITWVDLIESKTYNEQAEDSMEIILRWATGGVLGFDPMNESTKTTLGEI